MEQELSEIKIKSDEWIIVSKGTHGEIYEKKDGSVVITGTWDGVGMDYTAHFKDKTHS